MTAIKVDAVLRKLAREVLASHGLTFTERKPFPWFSVLFFVSGHADAIERAREELAAMQDEERGQHGIW